MVINPRVTDDVEVANAEGNSKACVITAVLPDPYDDAQYIEDAIDDAFEQHHCLQVVNERGMRQELDVGALSVSDYIDGFTHYDKVLIYADYALDNVSRIIVQSLEREQIPIVWTCINDGVRDDN
jgi:hypothetical protein